MDQKKDHMKMNSNSVKWMLETVTPEKIDEKNGVICLVYRLPFWVMVIKFS